MKKNQKISFINSYKVSTDPTRKQLLTSVKTSCDEIKTGFSDLVRNPGINTLFNLSKDLLGNTAWITNSQIKHLSNVVNTISSSSKSVLTLRERYMVEKVARNEELAEKFNEKEIFAAIFKDINHAHQNITYRSSLKCPTPDLTIVLVSGVFNEIFKTAAFERATEYLNLKNGTRYITPKVHGAKGIDHNVELLKEQLDEYIDFHPGEKLWLLSFSKGGVDSLHFMRKYPEFSNKHIIGLSTIASPITGADNADNSTLKLLDAIHQYSDTKLYKFLDQGKDILAKDLKNSLSPSFQRKWFKDNHNKLPKKPFYTALALESPWYKAHVYMLCAKILFRNKKPNDGVVDITSAQYPKQFKAINLGSTTGHHMVGARYSSFKQEALLEAHMVFLNYFGKFD